LVVVTVVSFGTVVDVVQVCTFATVVVHTFCVPAGWNVVVDDDEPFAAVFVTIVVWSVRVLVHTFDVSDCSMHVSDEPSALFVTSVLVELSE
jgi:hypothetical protein